MKASERRKMSQERKEKIAKRYKGVDPSKLKIIPARPPDTTKLEERKLKVAAYVRVSTEADEQKSSFELQVNEFTDRIKANPNWEFAGIYSDEGISGTNLTHRKGMQQLVEDAKAGKVELILAKSIARFARNVVDCITVIDTLSALNPPVGVRFDENGIYTLDGTADLPLKMMATIAEEESRSKSFIMNWSILNRFAKGIFLVPEVLGYDLDEEGDLVINQYEAETVEVMYYLYVNGWTPTEIAELLMKYGRETKLGNTTWSSSSVISSLENERHCGDVIAHKTYTPSYKDHKSKKNIDTYPKPMQEDHHDEIIGRDLYNAVMLMRSSLRFSRENRTLPVISVVDDGVLKGFVPVHKDWTGFSAEDYKQASESAGGSPQNEDESAKIRPFEKQLDDSKGHAGRKQLNMQGYVRISGELFPTTDDLTLTVSRGKLHFSTACIRKFEDVEYVELLLNSVTNTIAIRPCEVDNPNAIRWAKLKDERWAVRTMGCKGLSKILFELKDWTDDAAIRLSGQYYDQDGKLLLFSLDDQVGSAISQATEPQGPVASGEKDSYPQKQESVVAGENDSYPQPQELAVSGEDDESDESDCTALPPVTADSSATDIAEQIPLIAPEWHTVLGTPITCLTAVSLLERMHYSGDWEVLRPAREVESMRIFSRAELAGFLKKAQNIIEGWEDNGSLDTDGA